MVQENETVQTPMTAGAMETNPAGQYVPKILSGSQVEAHVSRLTAVRTQLAGYAAVDGRAAEAIPMIDAVIGSLQQAAFPTPTGVGVGAGAYVPDQDPDDLPFE